MDLWQHISEHISRASHSQFKIKVSESINGGCVNQAQVISDGKQQWFVKTNQAKLLNMLITEAHGLVTMANTGCIRVPAPLCQGEFQNTSYSVIEFIKSCPPKSNSQALAGEQLAAMHLHQNKYFGWSEMNSIGSSDQYNNWSGSWIDFWRQQRLAKQLELAAKNGYGGELQRQAEKLYVNLDKLIDHAPQPSLLHGDLWNGNIMFDSEGLPVIFDPACYYGDRETDIAMTELFGGYSPIFYDAYHASFPLDSGYVARKKLYNLYHLLNHLNLFGSSYKEQCINTIKQLLSECG